MPSIAHPTAGHTIPQDGAVAQDIPLCVEIARIGMRTTVSSRAQPGFALMLRRQLAQEWGLSW